ncbi:MAG: hypothetical protein IKD18_06275 [Clostridia bacterium]|nr:hypothetical protein [Clostridia bacterium]
MKQNRRVYKKKKTTYNEYNRNAMQWANTASRNPEDLNVLYDPRRGKYYLIGVSEDSDMGFIELNSGIRLQMERERDFYYEQHDLLDTSKDGLDALAKNIEDRQRDDNRDNVLFGQPNASERDGSFSFDGVSQGQQTTDGAGDLKGIEKDSGGVRPQSRTPYQSARDILVFYGENDGI